MEAMEIEAKRDLVEKARRTDALELQRLQGTLDNTVTVSSTLTSSGKTNRKTNKSDKFHKYVVSQILNFVATLHKN